MYYVLWNNGQVGDDAFYYLWLPFSVNLFLCSPGHSVVAAPPPPCQRRLWLQMKFWFDAPQVPSSQHPVHQPAFLRPHRAPQLPGGNFEIIDAGSFPSLQCSKLDSVNITLSKMQLSNLSNPLQWMVMVRVDTCTVARACIVSVSSATSPALSSPPAWHRYQDKFCSS